MEAKEQHVYLILSMSRSGHHAVMEWMFRRFPGRLTFKNDAKHGWSSRELKSEIECSYINPGEYDCLAYSIEDFKPTDYKQYQFDEFPIFCFPTTIIFIVRDPYNWAASSYKLSKQYPNLNPFKRVEIYKSQLKEILGYTNYIDVPFFTISYNEWFSSEDYRAELLRSFGLKGNAELIESVHKGSSFGDGNVLERYENIKDSRFWTLFDEELHDMSQQFFGFRL